MVLDRCDSETIVILTKVVSYVCSVLVVTTVDVICSFRRGSWSLRRKDLWLMCASVSLSLYWRRWRPMCIVSTLWPRWMWSTVYDEDLGHYDDKDLWLICVSVKPSLYWRRWYPMCTVSTLWPRWMWSVVSDEDLGHCDDKDLWLMSSVTCFGGLVLDESRKKTKY